MTDHQAIRAALRHADKNGFDGMPEAYAALDRLEAQLENPLAVVKEQAEDSGLWFIAETITETILQKALRRIHAAVEGEIYYGQ